jgi:hypothetical protein
MQGWRAKDASAFAMSGKEKGGEEVVASWLAVCPVANLVMGYGWTWICGMMGWIF